MSTLFKAKFSLIFAMMLWGSSFVGIRLAVQVYSPGGLALLRYLVASCLLLSTYWLFKQEKAHCWKDRLSAMGMGILGFAIYNVCLNYGERSVDAGVASFIISVVPIFVALLAGLIYREQLSIYAKLGFIVSIIGIFLIMLSEATKQITLDQDMILVLISAVSGAIYTVLQKSLLKRFNAIEFTAWAIWGGTFAMLIYLPHLIHDLQHAGLIPTGIVIYLGVFPGVIAYVCCSYGFKHMTATHAVSYSYWLPFFSTLLGFLMLGEIPKLLTLIGGIVAMAGSIIVAKSKVIVKA